MEIKQSLFTLKHEEGEVFKGILILLYRKLNRNNLQTKGKSGGKIWRSRT
jgi:hypothetical protein